MKRILLTKGQFAIIDDEDYVTVMRFKWYLETHSNLKYAKCCVYLGILNGRQVKAGMFMHHLIMRPARGLEVDHRNHNGLDCRRDNMRNCTHAQNIMNERPRAGHSSQYKGVSWYKAGRKWRAYIRVGGVLIFLGGFQTEKIAAVAYDKAAHKHFGEYAYLNFKEMYDGNDYNSNEGLV